MSHAGVHVKQSRQAWVRRRGTLDKRKVWMSCRGPGSDGQKQQLAVCGKLAVFPIFWGVVTRGGSSPGGGSLQNCSFSPAKWQFRYTCHVNGGQFGGGQKVCFPIKVPFFPFALPPPLIMDPPVIVTRTVTLYERSCCNVTHQTQPQPVL